VAKIVWLASYPKSGNTWMRVLLTNYLRDADVAADINRLDTGPIASSRVFFDEWVGVEASALGDQVIQRLRPEVFRCLLREATDTLYIKAHDAWGRTDRGDALFPADITAGVIYILRNPLDVAASCAHHWGVSADRAVEKLCSSASCVASSGEGTADQLRQQLGSWTGHVESWLNESGLPLHVVRYEDLWSDPENSFASVVRFCGLPWDAIGVRKAVAFSRFSELRRQEELNGFSERPTRSSDKFFRRGEVGSWREEISPGLAEMLITTHRECMRRFGYLDEKNHPI